MTPRLRNNTPHYAWLRLRTFEPMRLIRSSSAMVVLVTLLLLFFYSTLHIETSHSPSPGSEKLLEAPATIHVLNRDANTQSTAQNNSTVDLHQLKVPNKSRPAPISTSVSVEFRHAIPQNGAYWNRLLHSSLADLDKKKGSFRRDYNWSKCRETNRELLQTNVHDVASYPVVLQDFLQHMNCRSPPLLINQPNKCRDRHNNTFLLMAIKSIPANFERRQAVRETWGREGVYQNGKRIHRVFLLGSSPPDDPDLSALLAFEARHFGDLVQWDFNESLLYLTLKVNMLLRWTPKHCPNVSFVFSGDDDVFVNTPALLRYLQSLEHSKASRLYAGHVINKASPLRDPKSKYYIPVSFYDGPYPAYAGGGGFLISGALLKPLYSVSRVIPLFPMDDVYMGMCCMALGVSPEAHARFHTFDVKEQDRENLCVHRDLILAHQRSPKQIKTLWKGIHSPLLTC